MQIIKCDKCRKVKKEINTFRQESKWISGHVSGAGMMFLSYDLCENCNKEFVKVIKNNFGAKLKTS